MIDFYKRNLVNNVVFHTGGLASDVLVAAESVRF